MMAGAPLYNSMRTLTYTVCMFLCRVFVWLFLKAIYKGNLPTHQWHIEIFTHRDMREVPEDHYVVVKMELKSTKGNE